MNCELCSTDGKGGETRCRKCGFDTSLPPAVKRFLTSLTGFRPGDLLEARYRIERILGFGGMSVVYKAHDDMLNEDVAIKVINRSGVGDDAKLFTDIRRDIVITRKLAHPAIVKVHDLHQADACGFLTMEYVLGKDLASLLAQRGKLEEGEVCRLAIQIAEALSYAHANGVVHCDIKPGNLLLTETGRVKIADFGISRVMHDENTGLTGLVVGTPAYMSPEQIRGERPTPFTDMYALGIVMWHCLMGAPPYTRGDIAYQHVHVPLPPLEGVSPELERIVRKAASKTTADSYPSLDVMAQELHQFLQGQVDATIMQTPPPQEAATVMQTPPPRPAVPVVPTPPPQQAATVMQTPTPRPAVPVMQTPPPRPAVPVMQTPPPAPASTTAETAGGKALASDELTGGEPAGGGPPGGVPAAATTRPAPALPSASQKTRIALAAAAILIFGAALWAFLPSAPPTGPVGNKNTIAGNNNSTGGQATAVVRATAEPVASKNVLSSAATSGKPSPPVTQRTPAQKSSSESPRVTTPVTTPVAAPVAALVARSNPPLAKCTESACFEFFGAKLTPAVAQPGQSVTATARYTFRHDEGGTEPLTVEEAVRPGIRSSRGENRRVLAGPGPNLFEVSFTVSSRASAGTYPVTLSVRRRRITESVELQLVVTK